MKISNKYRERTAEIYRLFWDEDGYDYSEQALREMYLHDSLGTVKFDTATKNGFYWGKYRMSITIAMWKKDIADGLLLVRELHGKYPQWFLKNIGLLDYKYKEVPKYMSKEFRNA